MTAVLQGGERVELHVADTFSDRLLGLMPLPRRRAGRGPVAFPGCSSVHTFGMDVPLDVAFVDGAGVVVEALPAMPPGTIASCPGARLTLEQPCGHGPWPATGERLLLSVSPPGSRLQPPPDADRLVAPTRARQATGHNLGRHAMKDDPRTLFDMRIAHIGVNAQDGRESEHIAAQFARALFLDVSSTPVSHFAGSLVEVMDGCGRGEHGHIGLHVNDIRAAADWFEANGVAIDRDSWSYRPDGTPRLVYFKDAIAGFAVHLTSDE